MYGNDLVTIQLTISLELSYCHVTFINTNASRGKSKSTDSFLRSMKSPGFSRMKVGISVT